jgi:hypothetical protein
MDTQEQLTSWFNGLPRSIQAQALSMMHLITIEAIDEEGITDMSQAQAVIDRARRG